MAESVPAPPSCETPPPSGERRSSRIATIDGLRGCAVLFILVHHLIGLSPILLGPPGSFRAYLRVGLGLLPTGVDLFFVISGFLIGGILLDHNQSPKMLRTFYWRRFLRIIPLAWLYVGLCYLRHYLTGTSSNPELPTWVGLTFATNLVLATAPGWILSDITLLWSLGIEEQFYLFFPFVVKKWPRQHLIWIGPVLIATAIVSRGLILALAPQHSFACWMFTTCRLDALGVGFGAACLVRSAAWTKWKNNRTALWATAALLSLGMVILTRNQYKVPFEMQSWGYTVVAFFYGAVLLLVYDPPEAPVRGFFSAPVLRYYGKLSYFLYVFHGLVTVVFESTIFRGAWANAPWVRWLEGPVVIALMLIPAAVSWQLIEAPLLKIGRRSSY